MNAHTITQGIAASITTSAINTTGSDLIVIAAVGDTSDCGGNLAVSDNQSNTWTNINTISAGTDESVWMFQVHNPTVNASHTFTLTCSLSSAGVIMVQAWTGSGSGTVLDQNNKAAGSGASTTIQPGSITPSQAGSLLVTMAGGDASNPTTVNSSFTITDNVAFATGANYAGGMAYLVQGAAAAVNPTWTFLASVPQQAASIADFKPPASAVVPERTKLGVGE